MIDANLNRLGEGLRVLEDVARFLLSDAVLSRRLKALRHDTARDTALLRMGLLSERDSEHDVGHSQAASVTSGGSPPDTLTTPLQNLSELVTANAKRAEQSLRVIEELARLPDLSKTLDSASFEQARFTLYALEKELISRISRREKLESMSGLYVIVDRQFLAGRDELDIAEQAIEGGASTIQLRDKERTKRELLPVAQRLKALCNQAGVLFIVNDHLDLAIAADADGLHIGQGDLPVAVVRRALPIDRIVGCSVNTLAQAEIARNEGADYIALGSIFPTTTKTGAVVVGLDRLKELRQKVAIPLVAIGGINPDNVGEVMTAGADAIAVVSAVIGPDDVKGAVQKLIAAMESTTQKCQNT